MTMLEPWVPLAQDPELCRLDHLGPPCVRGYTSDDIERLFYRTARRLGDDDLPTAPRVVGSPMLAIAVVPHRWQLNRSGTPVLSDLPSGRRVNRG